MSVVRLLRRKWTSSVLCFFILVLGSPPEGTAVSMAHVGRDGLMEKLKELNIDTLSVEHPQVFTVDEMMPHVSHLPGIVSKNLLVRDKKKKGLWLVTAPHDAKISLSELAQCLGASGGLRLADEEVLVTKLGVEKGCVTPLALINDKENAVHCVVDAKLLDKANERVYFHPMVNSSTMGLSPADFEKFLSAVGHSPIVISFRE